MTSRKYPRGLTRFARISASAAFLLGGMVFSPPASGEFQLCGHYATSEQGPYVVMNDQWGVQTARQCIIVADTGFRISELVGASTDPNLPIGYPAMMSGCMNNHCSPDKSLPIKLRDLKSATSTVNFTLIDHGTYDAAYDMYLIPPGAPPPPALDPPDKREILIVLHGQNYPVGRAADKFLQERRPASLDGNNWWYQDTPFGVSAYVSDTSMSSATVNIKSFIDDVRSRHPEITDDWTLRSVFAGFECWSDCVGLAVNSFSVQIN